MIFADSFRYATIEPVKVTAPMKTPTNTSTSWMLGYRTSVSYELFQPTSTAARPTKLCSIAMSSGMPVISTTRARQMPIAPPMAIAARISPRPVQPVPSVSTAPLATSTPRTAAVIVMTRAMVIPMMP